MAERLLSIKRGGAWTKVVILVSLYVLSLQALIEWGLIVYLYCSRHVDSKMAPSLILALIASFFTVPLVTLHSFLAWQYNKVIGFGRQKIMLHTTCSYILRLMVVVWLAASVAGLVVVSQHMSCLPDSPDIPFWKTGVSCTLHRAVVIVSVLAFFTTCLYYCSRELCDRPYDVSLMGVYKCQRSICDESIFSTSSLGSEKSLKRDIFCVCHYPDVTYGTRSVYMPSIHSTSEKSTCTPNLQQPTPIFSKPFVRFSTEVDAEMAEVLSGTTISPNDTLSDRHPSDASFTPSVLTARALRQSQDQQLSERPGVSEAAPPCSHKRQKSSISSLLKYLPKAIPLSSLLSDDPQIRALADPSQVDIEKEVAAHLEDLRRSALLRESSPAQHEQPQRQEESTVAESSPINRSSTETTFPRSMTMNSAEAPEVVMPAPLNIRKSRITTTPQPAAPLTHATWGPPPQIPTTRNHHKPSVARYWEAPLQTNSRPTRIHTMCNPRRQNHFNSQDIPRYTQSHRFPRNTNRHYAPRVPARNRNDVEILYPSTRRPRINSYCGPAKGSYTGHLGCIRESGQSIDEPSPENTYRGANRTSMQGC